MTALTHPVTIAKAYWRTLSLSRSPRNMPRRRAGSPYSSSKRSVPQ
jgi:hypothetical protein